MKTLVIVSHPYQERSHTIKALEQTASDISDVTVRNLEALYGDDPSKIDIEAEQLACTDMDRIVFLFPVHWFNLTPMMKSYLNEVWVYGWAFGPEGKALQSKEMLVVATAGASEHTYSQGGIVESTIEEVLTPMKASALYVGMKYDQPLAFFEAADAPTEKLTQFQTKFSQRLSA